MTCLPKSCPRIAQGCRHTDYGPGSCSEVIPGIFHDRLRFRSGRPFNVPRPARTGNGRSAHQDSAYCAITRCRARKFWRRRRGDESQQSKTGRPANAQGHTGEKSGEQVTKGENMATKKNAIAGLPAQEYDAIPDIGDALRDQRLQKTPDSIHKNMMEGNVKGGSRMDDVDRKDWPEGEEL